MPHVRQHVPPSRARGPSTTPAGPAATGPAVGGRGNAAQADRLLGGAGAGTGMGAETSTSTDTTSGTSTETTTGSATTSTATGTGPTPAGAPTAATAPAGPIVLSREATRAGLASSVERIQVWAELWEVPFSSSWVRLDAANGAVVLDWPTGAWGAPPVTRDFSMGNMQGFDARWAVKTARDSAAWATLAGDVQTRVEAVLGGETNKLSSAAQSTMRRAIMNGWKTKPPEEQAKTLEDLASPTSSARPMGVAERNATARSQLSRAGPTDVSGHAFTSGAADASRYVLTWPDGQSVDVYVPKTKDPGLGYHTIEQVEEAVAYLPDANRKLLKTVQINPGRNPLDEHWAREYGRPNFRSYMTAGVAGVVDIYPDSTPAVPASQSTLTGSMQHESGHVWSQRTWGTDRTQGRWLDWRAAMTSDGVAVSGYATEDIQEDVAETVQAYSSTEGAPAHEEYRRMVPARFAILDTDLR